MAVRIIAQTVAMSDPETGPYYRTDYDFTEPVNGVNDGAVITPITEGLTESVFNALVAQAVADKANLDAATTQFTAAHVIGGGV